MTQEITEESFTAEILESNIPVMVDFTASWCMPCKAISPTIDELIKEFVGKVKIVKLDIDTVPKIVHKYDIRGVPTFIYFVSGKEVDRWVGLHYSKKDFQDKLSSLTG